MTVITITIVKINNCYFSIQFIYFQATRIKEKPAVRRQTDEQTYTEK